MEQAKLVHPSAFCWNPHCTDYGQVGHGNIRRFGQTQAGPNAISVVHVAAPLLKRSEPSSMGGIAPRRRSWNVSPYWPNATAWQPSIV
jgi:hypothetical protein